MSTKTNTPESVIVVEGKSYFYEPVKIVSKNAPLVAIPYKNLLIGVSSPETSVADSDAVIRVYKKGNLNLYILLTGKNTLKDLASSSEDVATLKVSVRIVSPQHLARTEVPPQKLNNEELLTSMQVLGNRFNVKLPKTKKASSSIVADIIAM
jgi:hypothetical protein